jgi:DNA repair exonuclease SbcCD ATPase subunit
MTKTELVAKIEALQAALDTKTQEQNAYRGQIDTLKKQLEDLNKPKLTPKQFDELHEAVEESISSFDFDDQDNYDMDFHIDYDNRIAVESMSFQNADEIAREVYNHISQLFGEANEDEISIQENLNQD